MSDDYAEATLSGAGTAALCEELRQRLDHVGQSGDTSLAEHVSEQLLSQLDTRAMCVEIRRRVLSATWVHEVAGEIVTEELGGVVTLSKEQLIEQFKENGNVTLDDLKPSAVAELTRNADDMADTLRDVAALVLDFDMSRMDTLRRRLARMHVFGPHSPQLPDAGDLTAPLFE